MNGITITQVGDGTLMKNGQSSVCTINAMIQVHAW